MFKSRLASLSVLMCLLVSFTSSAQTTSLWYVDNLSNIGGNSVTVVGNPVVTDFEGFKAVSFDGIDDGLFVANNPLVGATSFTVEVIFLPSPGGAFEQRFVHMQQDDNNRMLIELRSNSNDWYLDTFIKSGTSATTLVNTSNLHTLGQWHHAALVYNNGVMIHYVDGVSELSGSVAFAPVTLGTTSLGVRQTKVAWFKGAIRFVKVTHTALQPLQFTTIDVINGIGQQPVATKSAQSFQISRFYFNPMSGSAGFTIDASCPGMLSVDLISMTGITLNHLADEQLGQGIENTSLSLGELNPGVYFLRVNFNGDQQVIKFIVK